MAIGPGWGGIDSGHPWPSPSHSLGSLRAPNRLSCRLANPVGLWPTGVLSLSPGQNEKAAIKAASFILAGGEGFEPPLAESESAVLPLDDPPMGSNASGSKSCRQISAWRTVRRDGLYADRLSCARLRVRHGLHNRLYAVRDAVHRHIPSMRG